jgi:hypothetical protein
MKVPFMSKNGMAAQLWKEMKQRQAGKIKSL